MQTNNGPMALDGITVVELGTHVAVPNVTRAMADCGARVIKVENLMGEEWRVLGKNFGIPVTDEENAIFTNQNSNKELVALNLKSSEGMGVFKQLIARADVFITNVRLKSLQKMGLDYDSLKAAYPSLVFCHFTGFGYEGPDAQRPGFDTAAFWARSGAMIDWNNAGDFPLKPITGFGDSVTGSMLLSGVLMALLARERTGKGTLVSSSLYGSAIWYNATGVVVAQAPYGCKYPKSRYEPVTPFSHIYECMDHNWIVVSVVNYDQAREKMFRLLRMEAFLEDERFDTIAHATKHKRQLVEILNEKFMERTRDEWAAIFQEHGIVYEKLVHYSEIADDPQAIENRYLEKVAFPSGTQLNMPRLPIEFSEYGVRGVNAAGRVGRDTGKVLEELGYSPQELTSMRERQLIK